MWTILLLVAIPLIAWITYKEVKYQQYWRKYDAEHEYDGILPREMD